MKTREKKHEDASVHVTAAGWPEIAAATTDGSGLAVDNGPEKARAGWPEASAFATDGWATVEFGDIRRKPETEKSLRGSPAEAED